MFSFKSIVLIAAAFAVGAECSVVAAPLVAPAHVGYAQAIPQNIPPYASQVSVVNRAVSPLVASPFAAPYVTGPAPYAYAAAPFAAPAAFAAPAFPAPAAYATAPAAYAAAPAAYAATPAAYAAAPAAYASAPAAYAAAPAAYAAGPAAYAAAPFPYAPAAPIVRAPFGVAPAYVR